jgi:carbonic anhydrase
MAVGIGAGCGEKDEGQAGGTSPPAFSYSGDTGPSHWDELDPANEECDEGRRQSPIDLEGAKPSPLPELEFSYRPGTVTLENNGHSVEAGHPAGNSVQIEDTTYELDQFHFHAPSEHDLGGRSFPLEFHFVNLAEDGSTAVVGVFAKEGRSNPAFEDLAAALPAAEGDTAEVEVDALDLLPPDPGSVRRFVYEGSLTTPPCTEGVSWNVLAEPIEMSAEQIDRYTAVYDDTDRPLQPLAGRELRVSAR